MIGDGAGSPKILIAATYLLIYTPRVCIRMPSGAPRHLVISSSSIRRWLGIILLEGLLAESRLVTPI
jgi:hypothetical protein